MVVVYWDGDRRQWVTKLSIYLLGPFSVALDGQAAAGAGQAAVTALGKRAKSPWKPVEQARYGQLMDSMQDQLGEEVFAALWAEGQIQLAGEVLEQILASGDQAGPDPLEWHK
jgi:hypothetical protein